ncbi:hypothetical protein [Streptomyces sp. NPDC055400]
MRRTGHEFGVLFRPFEGDDGDGRIGAGARCGLDDSGWIGGRPALHPALGGLPGEGGERPDREQDRDPGGTQDQPMVPAPPYHGRHRRTSTNRSPPYARHIRGLREGLAMVWTTFYRPAAQRRWAAHSHGVRGPSMAVRVRLSAPR